MSRKLIFAIVLFPIFVFAQNSLKHDWATYNFDKPKTQVSKLLVETDEFFFIPIAYGETDYFSFGIDYTNVVYKTDKQFNIVDTFIINEFVGYANAIDYVKFRSDCLYIFTSHLNPNDIWDSKHYWYSLDENFSTSSQPKEITLSTLPITHVNTVINDSLICFSALNSNSGNSLIGIDFTGNLIFEKEIDYSPSSITFFDSLNSIMLSSPSHNESTLRVFLDADSLSLDSIGKPNPNRGIRSFKRISKDSSSFLAIGHKFQPNAFKSHLIVSKLNMRGQILNTKDIPLNNNNAVWTESIYSDGDSRNEMIYTIHSEDYNLSNRNWSKLIVTKYDANIQTILWQKDFLLGERRMGQSSAAGFGLQVLATKDGGVLISYLANWVDTAELDYYKVFLLKLDANGSAMAQTSYDLPAAQHQCYPNPGQNMFYLNLGEKFENTSVEVALYNAAGQKVLSQHLHNPAEAVNTEILSSGFYFYEASANGRPIAKGKWVKE